MSLPNLIPVLGITQYLVLPNYLTLDEVKQTIKQLNIETIKRVKIRIVYDNIDFEKTIIEELNTLSTIKYNFYVTNFFELHTKNIFEYTHQSLIFTQVRSTQAKEYDIIEDFLCESHAVKVVSENGVTEFVSDPSKHNHIKTQLPSVVAHKDNFVYLVKYNDMMVGCFELAQVNEYEIQLHGVSGRARVNNLYKGKKLPLLAKAVHQIMKTQFSHIPKLTFSNSNDKVSSLYEKCGFTRMSGRKCIIVENKT